MTLMRACVCDIPCLWGLLNSEVLWEIGLPQRGFFLLIQSGNILEFVSINYLCCWAFIWVGVQLTTGGSGSDALQDLYKSLQVDSEQTISGVDDGGCVIKWQEH